MSKRKDIVIVLGMHRSGTSGITNYIAQLGYDLGNNLMAANHENVKGFFEDIDIYNFNEDILNYLDITWQDIEHTAFRKISLLKNIVWNKFGNIGISILNEKLKTNDRIVIKDPRFCILLPFWEKVFLEMNVNVFRVFVLRNPLDVIKSLESRNGFSIEKSKKLWLYYNINCIKDSSDILHVINFEDFITKKNNLFEKLSEFSSNYKLVNPNTNIIDKKIIHHSSTDIQTQEFANDNPEIIDFYNKIYKKNTIEFDINYSTSESYINPDITNTNEKLISNLFLDLRSNNTSEKPIPIQCTHKPGKQTLKFKLPNKTSADTFNIFFCDKPIILHVKSIQIFSNGEIISIDRYTGNYILNEENKFVFNTNKPEIIFELESPLLIQDIIVDCQIIDDPHFISNFKSIIYKHHLNIERIDDINSKIENLNQDLKLKNDESLLMNNQITVLEQKLLFINENKKYLDSQIKDLTTIIKIEKEKNHELEEENNNLTAQIQDLNARLKIEESKISELLEREKTLINTINLLKSDYDILLKNNDSILIELTETRNNNTLIQDKLNEEIKKSEYLYSLKLEHDDQILLLKRKEEELNEKIDSIYKSLSWQITLPFRFIMKSLKIFALKNDDVKFGLELLKREGIRSFVNRLYWYLRGYRLNEDIYIKRNKLSFSESNNNTNDFTAEINLPKYIMPLVSIIIPVYNQWEYTYRCIKSIFENTSEIPYEIIVADDVSNDETLNIKKIIKNVILIRNKKNLKFVLNNNNAAKHARGKYLHFLNNDTVVHPNWLKPLVDVFEKNEKAGIVGSKLVYPDGKLQEAGGIIWNDASGWNYGRLDDPNKPEYNYLRETDYISGASFLIKKEIWEELNGFDELFVPAYYEDTDIAFRIRAKGYQVIYQPLSVVTHFEGISNGKDLTEGLKKYQIDNGKKFKERWKETLEKEHNTNSIDVFLAKDRSFQKKQILVIDHYVPHFDKDAGSRSTFSYLSLLVKMGYKVTFIGDNFFKHEPYTEILQQIGIEVYYGNYYFKNIQSWLKENGKYFHFAILHRMHIAPKYISVLKKYSKAKLLYVGHDLQFLSSQKKYESTKDRGHLMDAEKFKIIELDIFNSVDTILPFSTLEEKYINEIAPNKMVQSIPVYFFDNIPTIKNGFSNRNNLLFVGGFAHPPNEDALFWFVNNVFSDIKKKFPNIKLFVVGSNPTEKVKQLASDSIIITGYVTDEKLKHYYLNCKVAILPLQYGAGVKGKLLEALYYQIPSVITSVAAEGVPEIEKYTLIANTAKDFKDGIQLLYENETKWNEYSIKGKELIDKYFTEDAARSKIEEVLKL